jgi:ribonuclease D
VTEALAEYDPAKVPEEPRDERPTTETQVGIAQLLSTLVKVRGQQLGIAASSLARSEQVGHLLALHAAGRQEESELMQGWRREAIGADLVNLLDGHSCLRIVDGQITLA